MKCRTAFLHRRNGILHTGHKYTGLITPSSSGSSPESASPASSALPVSAYVQLRRKVASPPVSASSGGGARSAGSPFVNAAASNTAPMRGRACVERGKSAHAASHTLLVRRSAAAGSQRGWAARRCTAVAAAMLAAACVAVLGASRQQGAASHDVLHDAGVNAIAPTRRRRRRHSSACKRQQRSLCGAAHAGSKRFRWSLWLRKVSCRLPLCYGDGPGDGARNSAVPGKSSR